MFSNNPGTIRWWAEYFIYRLFRRCNHSHIDKGWVHGSGCDEAWRAEHYLATHTIMGTRRSLRDQLWSR